MKKLATTFLIACAALSAQAPEPVYRVTVTARTVKAVSYQHRSGETKIDFTGTSLMPNASGMAKVEGKKGVISIAAEFRGLPEATQFGAEYLTYVLWAVTPDGRTSNLGELIRDGDSAKLAVTTELQQFALIVTAEPYFAVSRPSDVVALENEVRRDTNGGVEPVEAKYELFQRGQYSHLANVLDLKVDRKMPIELYEARNAVQIARTSGADQYAKETFQKAEAELKQAEEYRSRNVGSKPLTMASREAVQTAEDARAIAVKRQDDDALAAEKQAGSDRTLRAENGQAAAQAETDRLTRAAVDAKAAADRMKASNDAQTIAAQAEAARLKQENDDKALIARNEAAGLKADNDAQRAAAQAEAARMKASNDAQTIATQTEAARLKRENDDKALMARNEAAGLKADNDAQRAAAQTELDRLGNEKNRLEREKVALRAQLLFQFNAILQTRDTARGLIVNMSDVLFDTGKFTLRPEAREKLARVAGIVEGHPGLRLAVEGYTDSVGTDEFNQTLSERRGSSVREDLITQGMAADSVTSAGFGKSMPVSSNDTAVGRQRNRRVELVISGDVIGTVVGVPLASN
jgi:outer membrane protein OmpA-like peptidoglycan-associated protein